MTPGTKYGMSPECKSLQYVSITRSKEDEDESLPRLGESFQFEMCHWQASVILPYSREMWITVIHSLLDPTSQVN